MTAIALDVIGVGNAIVDVLAEADDAFLARHEIPKGGMLLIDEARARHIYDGMGPGREISGGSAANSIACIASLGGRGGFVGKVSADALGDIFRHDLRSMGVCFDTKPLQGAPGTGRCLINVTPDAQRSMTTFLGAAGHVTIDDIDEAFIASSAILFFEGYLFEQADPRRAFVKACAAAKRAGRRAAITLSDASVVERQHDALIEFIGSHVDVLLANDREAAALFGSDDHAEIARKAREFAPLTAVTLSEKGSLLIPRDGEAVRVPAVKPDRLIDTTGAGDAYAAGLLLGLAKGFDLARAGALGSLAAAEVISHFGARPEQSLQALAAQNGLI